MDPVSDKTLIDSLPVGTALCRQEADGRYRVLSLNRTAAARLGMGADEMTEALAGGLESLLHPDDAARFQLMLYKGGVTGGRFSEPLRMRLRDGCYHWVDIRLNATPEADGSCLMAFAVVDVDNKRQNDLKLEHTYEQLLGVMNNAPGGIVVFDTKNDRDPYPSFISPGMFRLLGGTREECESAYARDFHAAVHGDDAENLVRGMEDALRNLSQFHLTLRLRRVDGDCIWVDANGTVAAFEGKRSLYVSVTDASADREDNLLLRRILDILVSRQYDLICLVDAASSRFRVLSADPRAAARLTEKIGRYDEAVIKLADAYAMPGEKKRLAAELKLDALVEKLSASEDAEFFLTLSMPDGERRYKKLWVSWLDESRRRLAFVLSDYTEPHRRQLEHQQALVEAVRAAEQANIAKSVFLSRMSHDIRTPLNAIIGFTRMSLLDGETDGETRERLGKIESASQYLLSLVNDVLDMSRIESGKFNLAQEPFRIADLLAGVGSIITAQCGDRGLEYSCQTEAAVRETYIGDRLKLQQVLVNILGNSVKFTPRGGHVALRVSENAAYDRHAMLRFVISDDGVGISEEFMPHLFETFTQEDAGGTGQPGTGLGLAICRSIVAMMKGGISVESRKNTGSVFTVDVQLGIPEPDAAPEAAKPAPETGRRSFAGRRILLAEDNPMNQEIARYLLEKVGFEVDAAENGELACRRFAASAVGTYSAVILDIRMPVMDGIEAARTIRAMPRADAPEIPLIAMSADAFEEDISKSLSNGICAHLIKPINPDQLYGALEKYIK